MDFPFVKEAISQLFSKPSCAMYPAVPSEAAPNYRGRIVYHADKCIGCGMCERVCAGNAISRTVEKTEEGDKITLTGRLQSRAYQKQMPDGSVIEKTAYEVSVGHLELLDGAHNADPAQAHPAHAFHAEAAQPQ